MDSRYTRRDDFTDFGSFFEPEEESSNQLMDQQEDFSNDPNFNNNSKGEHQDTPQQVDECRYPEESSCHWSFKDESIDEIKSMIAKLSKQCFELDSRVEGIATHTENLGSQIVQITSSKESYGKEEEVVVPIKLVEEICDQEICSSNGKTREDEMMDEDEISSNGKTRESEALTKEVVPSNGKTRAIADSGDADIMSSQFVESPPCIVLSHSSSRDKERMMEKVHAKVLSAIQIMKTTGGSKFLLENDNEVKDLNEALMIMKAKVARKDSKKEKYDRRAARQREARRRGRNNDSKELDGVGPNNERSRSQLKDNDVSTREDMVNKFDDGDMGKPPNDPGKSLSPSHKLKEKVNSKCSTVWKVKDKESNRACLERDKSVGEPPSKNKQLKLGWDPPVIPPPSQI